MFLKSLSIFNESQAIRDIQFHKGLNLIVDETPITAHGKETGNNVGKTTVLALIDFCFNASSKSIYTDPENKKDEYKLVKNFLIDNQILIRLVLTSDLDNEKAAEVCIERNFMAGKKKIQRINNVNLSNDEFDEGLTNILFSGHYGKKPTIRQIIAHNIRYKDISINYTLKILDRFTRDDEYETLYLFLFGCSFEDGDSKQELRSKIRIEETFKTRLEKNETKSAYEIALTILDREIEDLEKRKLRLNANENFTGDFDKLTKVKYQVNFLASEISKLNIRRDLIIEAQQTLSASIASIDLQQLEHIYHQARAHIGSLQKTFEELVDFHNRMVGQKIKYISRELPSLELDIKSKHEKLQSLLDQERQFTNAITQSESFEDLERLISEINEKYRKKGEFESILLQLKEVESNLTSLNTELESIDDALFSEEFYAKVKAQVNKFNLHFAEVSQSLYGEQYAVKVDRKTDKKGKRLYEFSAFNTNMSSGKKQGEISCFDIAYTVFADQENIPCLHFLLNDKKELMHDNQLIKIAKEVERRNIQFIASILRDKLPTELNSEQYIIVKLSQSDKLFRIEHSNKSA